MIWTVVVVVFVVCLLILYTGYVRREIDSAFVSQDAMLARFGGTIHDMRKRTNQLVSDHERLRQKVWKLEEDVLRLRKLQASMIQDEKPEEVSLRDKNVF
ncbi:hypothetical protein [Ponticaulis profundi]|uniref:Uncharacterized protein n=1 Tax=Ponticaulis profundi TaxID=2665222 RepID=A0ABW1SBL4_9PROT